MNTPTSWDDPRITAYVMCELSGDELAMFEKELSNNQNLAAAVDEAREVTDKLAGLFAAESTPVLSDDRRDSIISGANTSTQNISAPTKSWKIPLLLLSTAAVVALIVGLAPMLRQPTTTVSQAPARTERPIVLSEVAERTPMEPEELPELAFIPESGKKISAVVDRELKPADVIELSKAAPATPAPFNDFSFDGSVKLEMPATEGMMEAESTEDMMLGGSAGGMKMMRNRVRRSRLQEKEFAEVAGDRIVMDMAPDLPISGEPELMRESLLRSGLRLEKTQLLDSKLSSGQPPDIRVVPSDEGRGPGMSGDKFDPITDNPFKRVDEHPLSTFSVDVDTASYSKTRDFLMRANQLPRPDAVRIEELVNYFDYDYDAPANDAEHPFAARVNITSCPWNDAHRLARIAIKGKTMQQDERPACNLVFLIDTSGSMNEPNKLPLVIEGMKMLVNELGEEDRVAITVYAGSAGLVLDSTSAKKGKKIRKALTQLSAGGSTNGGAGIQLAYQTARENFIKDGVNRVILCSDGDFNVGTTGTDDLVRMVEQEAKGGVFLSVLGFGMGNHNDAMLEQISGRGNGNYAFIDTDKEARKVLVDQVAGTLVTIAKDVKIQIEFNSAKVSSYRLIGYENRVLAKEDFNDDKKDAGEIGAGHAVTALYEIVPAGVEADASRPKVDVLKYQAKPAASDAADSNETLTIKLRYKEPDGDTSTLVEFPVTDDGEKFGSADIDTRFAAAVASFGMQLRRSEYAGSWTMTDVLKVAESSKGDDKNSLRSEFVELVGKAQELMGQQ